MSSWISLLILGVGSLHIQGMSDHHGDGPENVLHADLFSTITYDRNLYPRCKGETIGINVTLDLSLRQIVELEEQSQLLTAMTWMRWQWRDCRLKWDGALLGIDNITVSSALLWIPDVTLYESTGDPLHQMLQYPARVFCDGTVHYNFPALVHATCKINMEHFPFDRQVCQLSFSSWVYTMDQLDLYPKHATGDTSQYINNGEWNLRRIGTLRKESEYPETNAAYAEVYFHVFLQRRSIYYVFNIMFPTILVSLVAILSFCLPPASGEKVSLSVTSLLTQTVFMLMLSQEMPATSETIPLLQMYFGMTLCVVSVSTILTIFVLNVHYRGYYGERVSPRLRKIFLNQTMIRIFHPNIPQEMRERHREAEEREAMHQSSGGGGFTNYAHFEENSLPRRLPNGLDGLKFTAMPCLSLAGRLATPEMTDRIVTGRDGFTSKEQDVLADLSKTLKTFIERSKGKQKSRIIENEWGDLAIVMDRLFFVVTMSAFVITSLAMVIPNVISRDEV